MWLFKICGMVLIFSVCTLLGFSKAAVLKKRAEKLSGFCRSAEALKERIRVSGGEIKPLLQLTFSGEQLIFEEDRFYINESYLKKEDVALLDELLSGIGMGDAFGECERISAYVRLIKNRSDEAMSECESLCRLYRSLGPLSGLFICIFFL